MRAVFKNELDDSEALQISQFCASTEYFAIEQTPGFLEILGTSNTTYFYLTDEKEIVSFCLISENFKFAQIWFGPVCDDVNMMIESVLRIAEYYKKKHFWYLGIQAYHKTGYEADYIEYALNQQLRITYVFSAEHTKSSLEIDLNQSLEKIFSEFRKGHKSAIKKAINSGIVVAKPETSADLNSFIEVYLRMCRERGIKGHTRMEVAEICRFVVENKCGNILLAKDHESEVIGGAVFVSQGLSVRYLLSAADPARRDLPATHLILFKEIEWAKEAKLLYFDFWGYNHFAHPDDQIYLVNRFKRGFGGYFIFLMKRMNISLVPGGFKIFLLYKKTGKLITAFRTIIYKRNLIPQQASIDNL